MLILVSNDDGYMAKGVARLSEWLSRYGEVVSVCPSTPQSGMSMAITVNRLLHINRLQSENGETRYMVDGTPADCVKIAMHTILRDRRPDLVVTGINHGSNAAVNVLYSGTMGAAMEGCAFGIPSIGFSLTDHDPDADFEPCRPYVEKIVEAVAKHGLPDGLCLNVNIPDIDHVPAGMRVARACAGHWSDEYVAGTEADGSTAYRLEGEFINDEPDMCDTDLWCLDNETVSVVPVLLERTAPAKDLPLWLRELGKEEK